LIIVKEWGYVLNGRSVEKAPQKSVQKLVGHAHWRPEGTMDLRLTNGAKGTEYPMSSVEFPI
jgi:hypothetical protein